MSKTVYAGDPIDTEMYSAFAIEPDAVQALREAHYSPEILEVVPTVSVKDDGEDTSHNVFKLRCLSKPIQQADAVEDEMILYACDCKGYLFHRMRRSQGDDSILAPPEIDDQNDPHIQAVCKSKKAEADDSQETLL